MGKIKLSDIEHLLCGSGQLTKCIGLVLNQVMFFHHNLLVVM